MRPENQKITLEVPRELLERAQRASGKSITETVRQGLDIVAKGDVYERLRKLQGTHQFPITWRQLKGKE
ncbi:MAG: hypothetical protein ACRD01_13540 [Terriglobales bacterium]